MPPRPLRQPDGKSARARRAGAGPGELRPEACAGAHTTTSRALHPGTAVRTVILGAAGRDFHNFNTVYRDDPDTRVVAFTAAQIPGIAGRRYPPSLAGALYPDGIPILPEETLEAICHAERIERVVFAYSDVPHEGVMHLASRALACGADFELLGPDRTSLTARVPVIAVSAVRTGCGKSQIARWLAAHLRTRGFRVAVVRHPMPYGDLERQRIQRFATAADLRAAECTVEEREEYEPHIGCGAVVFSGVDYGAILAHAESEADVIVWDGGNNDFPFFRPDLHIVVLDALRPGQAARFHPGEATLRMADIVVINKVDAADPDDLARVEEEARRIRPAAVMVHAASPVVLDRPELVSGRRVLVVEDGPTITHGGMSYGAGFTAALRAGAKEIIDPRPFLAESLRAVFDANPHIGSVLPAVGYDAEELLGLRDTINASDAEAVVIATPADIAALVHLSKPVVRATYGYAPAGEPALECIVDAFLSRSIGDPDPGR